jgi:hypothetical protein
MPNLPPSNDSVGTRQGLEESRKIAWIALQIAGHGHDQLATYCHEAGMQRGHQAPVAPESDGWTRESPQATDDLDAAIATAVVDENHLGGPADAGEDGVEFPPQDRQAGRFVRTGRTTLTAGAIGSR